MPNISQRQAFPFQKKNGKKFQFITIDFTEIYFLNIHVHAHIYTRTNP